MCKVFEELEEKRILDEKRMLAESMLRRGRGTAAQIAEDLDLPIEVVEELVNSQLM